MCLQQQDTCDVGTSQWVVSHYRVNCNNNDYDKITMQTTPNIFNINSIIFIRCGNIS